MLATYQKIHLNKDFDKIFKTGQAYYGQFLGLRVLDNRLNYPRFAILLSSKIEKSSVKRHYLKRLIYRKLKDLEFKKNKDCVIIVLIHIKSIKDLELKIDLELKKLFNLVK